MLLALLKFPFLFATVNVSLLKRITFHEVLHVAFYLQSGVLTVYLALCFRT